MIDEDKKAESPFNDPPEEVLQDPIYHEAYMKQWAKYVFDQRVFNHNRAHSDRTEFQSASMEIIKDAASNAGKSLIILNGAAAIAVLTKVASEPALIKALLMYSWGAGTGALVFAGTYFSQHFFSQYKNKVGIGFQIAAIFFFVVGFIAFILGGYFTESALGAAGSSVPLAIM